MEYWTGWYDTWGNKHNVKSAKSKCIRVSDAESGRSHAMGHSHSSLLTGMPAQSQISIFANYRHRLCSEDDLVSANYMLLTLQ